MWLTSWPCAKSCRHAVDPGAANCSAGPSGSPNGPAAPPSSCQRTTNSPSTGNGGSGEPRVHLHRHAHRRGPPVDRVVVVVEGGDVEVVAAEPLQPDPVLEVPGGPRERRVSVETLRLTVVEAVAAEVLVLGLRPRPVQADLVAQAEDANDHVLLGGPDDLAVLEHLAAGRRVGHGSSSVRGAPKGPSAAPHSRHRVPMRPTTAGTVRPMLGWPAELLQLALRPARGDRRALSSAVRLLAVGDVPVGGRRVPRRAASIAAGRLGDFGYPIELGAQELACGCGGGAPVRFVCHAHAHGSPAILGSCRRRRGFGLVGRA